MIDLTVGTDLVEIARVRRALKRHRPRLEKRLFTEREWEYCQSQQDPWASLGVRFAAKEALRKIFGQWGKQGVVWRETEIAVTQTGAPVVHLHGRAREWAGAMEFALSLAHTKKLAQAFCVAWRPRLDD